MQTLVVAHATNLSDTLGSSQGQGFVCFCALTSTIGYKIQHYGVFVFCPTSVCMILFLESLLMNVSMHMFKHCRMSCRIYCKPLKMAFHLLKKFDSSVVEEVVKCLQQIEKQNKFYRKCIAVFTHCKPNAAIKQITLVKQFCQLN